ncbi:MAG TPA: hypothetical protein VHF90_00725 [Thermoleophilaceae bacterium]|nr:hypothetical protein [Thermoleophilaceae bacterium]
MADDPHTLQMRRFLRLLAVLAALSLLVAGLGACGGDDDEPQDSGSPASEARTEPGAGDDTAVDKPRSKAAGKKARNAEPAGEPALTGDPQEARQGVAAVDEVYEGFDAAAEAGVAAVDVPALQTLETADENESLTNVCDLMSEEAKRQTIVYAKRSAGLADVEWTCEKATGLLLRRARQTGGLKRSLQAEVVGVNVDGDRATASVRFGGKGPISSVPLVKEDGEWKLAASPSGGGDQ